MDNKNWLLFSFTLPGRNQAGRMRVWRRLTGLGAVIVKSALYALPLREDLREQLAWLTKEVEDMGGEALLLETGPPANLSGDGLAALFTKARDADWQETEDELLPLVDAARAASPGKGGPGGKPGRARKADPDGTSGHARKARDASGQEDASRGAAAPGQAAAQHAARKLARRVQALEAIDFFPSGRGERARKLLDELTALASGQAGDGGPQPAIPRLNPDDFKGKVWLTRQAPYIDRLACIWLVRRFVDPEAALAFVPPGERPGPRPGIVRFDMDEAEFTHTGPLTTFETLCAAFGLGPAVPERLRAIIRAVDLNDLEAGPAEAAGVKLVLDGLCALALGDENRAWRAMELFDALLATCNAPKGE